MAVSLPIEFIFVVKFLDYFEWHVPESISLPSVDVPKEGTVHGKHVQGVILQDGLPSIARSNPISLA